jgi:hypothetical protein
MYREQGLQGSPLAAKSYMTQIVSGLQADHKVDREYRDEQFDWLSSAEM